VTFGYSVSKQALSLLLVMSLTAAAVGGVPSGLPLLGCG
jgi:hypothetical protein